jgi:hypothetical protein
VFEFCSRLKASGQYSIDAFLERQPKFLTVGKAAIAAQLLPCEWNLFARECEEGEDWYRYLFARMAPKAAEDFPNNRLKVITFNFDHSFEWRLAEVLRATYDISVDDATRLAASIEIVHVHGELATTPLPPVQAKLGREHAPEPEEVMACVEKIQIGAEALKDDRVALMTKWLTDAERVIFLGFSFNRDNLDKLPIPLASKQLFGTAHLLSDADKAAAYRFFKKSPGYNYLLPWTARRFFDYVNVFE